MPFFLNLYFQAPKYPLAHVSMQIQTKPRTPSLMALPGIPMHFKKSDRQDLGGCFCLHEIYTKI